MRTQIQKTTSGHDTIDRPWHSDYDNINNISLFSHVDVATRGNKYKLYQSSVKYDLRKHFFTKTVVSLC